jgi:hypothetical protein
MLFLFICFLFEKLEEDSSQNPGEFQDNVQAHPVQIEKSDPSTDPEKTSSDAHQGRKSN